MAAFRTTGPPLRPSSLLPPPQEAPQYGSTNLSLMANPPDHHPQPAGAGDFKKKSLLEAYILGAMPFGLLGAHHFYLGRPLFGVLYFFTLGLGCCGYLIDLFRMPWLVAEANETKARSAGQNEVDKKSLSDAYTLWFPFGLLGFHHFYLGRYAWAMVYLFTLGLGGLGWLVDAVRLPTIVREINERKERHIVLDKDHCTAYALMLPPVGIFGGHHYYLNRPLHGLLYSFTLGLFGLGWFWDWCRIPRLVKRANLELKGERSGDQKTMDDAYILWFPFGLFGAHQFYLGRPGWGTLYFFTWGLLGIGWLTDACRIPYLVQEANKEIAKNRPLPNTASTSTATSLAAGHTNDSLSEEVTDPFNKLAVGTPGPGGSMYNRQTEPPGTPSAPPDRDPEYSGFPGPYPPPHYGDQGHASRQPLADYGAPGYTGQYPDPGYPSGYGGNPSMYPPLQQTYPAAMMESPPPYSPPETLPPQEQAPPVQDKVAY